MFNTANTNVWEEREYLNSTKQNVELMLQTHRGEMFGDPYFGLLLKQFMFDQNNKILRDAVIDMIYTQLALFIPQIYVQRKDISIIQDRAKGKLYCSFYGVNQVDYQVDTYNIVLFQNSEN